MKFHLVWEQYSKEWTLVEKGFHFINVNDPFDIDTEVFEYLERVAESRGVDKKYFVLVNCQPMPAFREENEPWKPAEENSGELDPMFDQAVAYVVNQRRASVSGVQRHLRIGYNRAARIIEQMETQGIVSSVNHAGHREVL